MIRYTAPALIKIPPKVAVVGDKLQAIFGDRQLLSRADK